MNILFRFAAGALLTLAAHAVWAEGQKVIATVNGKPIYEEQLRGFSAGHDAPAMGRDQAINDLVARELVYQDALKRGLDKNAQVQKELQEMQQRVLMSAAVRAALDEHPVTEEELQTEYDALKSQMARQEFKARHILVDSQEKAQSIITELKGGADFTALARKHSGGPTGKNGGDLGWFSAEQMVPPFAEAVRGLKKGAYTQAPVQTQYGWHVILLDDTRNVPAPAFAEVKERLRAALQQRRIAQYVEGLKSSAKIEIK